MKNLCRRRTRLEYYQKQTDCMKEIVDNVDMQYMSLYVFAISFFL